MGDLLLPHITERLAWGMTMRGSIGSRQKCPQCGRVGKYRLVADGRSRGLVCACGDHVADKLEVVIRHRGKTHRIAYTKSGHRLVHYTMAEAAQAAIDDEIERKIFDPSGWGGMRSNRMLWQNYLADYFKREKKRAGRSYYKTKQSHQKHLEPAFAGLNIREIRTAQVDDWIIGPLADSGLMVSTQASVCRTLRHLFNEAARRGDVDQAPKVRSPEVVTEPPEWLGKDVQENILDHMPREHRPIYRFMMLYGVRVAEAGLLSWSDIDFEHELLIIRRTFSRGRVIEHTKAKKVRVLPLFSEMRGILAKVPKGIGDARVFRNPKALREDKAYTPDVLRRIWNDAVAAAGEEPIKLKNATRHSAGMQIVNEIDGATVDDAAALLGNSPEVCRKFYAHPQVARLRRVLEGKKAIVNQLSIASSADKTPNPGNDQS